MTYTLEERHLTAALAVWNDAVKAARLRGLITPKPDAIARERYEAAIEGARKAPQGRAVHAAGDELPKESADAAAQKAGEKVADKMDDGVPPARTSRLRELTAVLDWALRG